MNILTDVLASTVNIAGVVYPINTDFRLGVEFEIAVQNDTDKIPNILSRYFGGTLPDKRTEDVFEAVMWFYCCGDTNDKKGETNIEKKQGYSFAVDSNAIFADFWNYYHIDLSREQLHWWAFRSLLEGLPEESDFKQRIYYRTCDTKGLTKKEREHILKIRSKLEIKKKQGEKLTLEERNNNMLAYVARRTKEVGGGNSG